MDNNKNILTGCLLGLSTFYILDKIVPNFEINIQIQKRFLIFSASILTTSSIIKIMNKD